MHGRTAAVAAGDGRQKFQTPILGLPSTELDTSGAAFGADSGPSSGGEPDLCGSVGRVISIQQKLTSPGPAVWFRPEKVVKKSQHRGEFHGAVHPESERLGA